MQTATNVEMQNKNHQMEISVEKHVASEMPAMKGRTLLRFFAVMMAVFVGASVANYTLVFSIVNKAVTTKSTSSDGLVTVKDVTEDEKMAPVAKMGAAKSTMPLGFASYMTLEELTSVTKIMLNVETFADEDVDVNATLVYSAYSVLGFTYNNQLDMHFDLTEGTKVTVSGGKAHLTYKDAKVPARIGDALLEYSQSTSGGMDAFDIAGRVHTEVKILPNGSMYHPAFDPSFASPSEFEFALRESSLHLSNLSQFAGGVKHLLAALPPMTPFSDIDTESAVDDEPIIDDDPRYNDKEPLDRMMAENETQAMMTIEMEGLPVNDTIGMLFEATTPAEAISNSTDEDEESTSGTRRQLAASDIIPQTYEQGATGRLVLLKNLKRLGIAYDGSKSLPDDTTLEVPDSATSSQCQALQVQVDRMRTYLQTSTADMLAWDAEFTPLLEGIATFYRIEAQYSTALSNVNEMQDALQILKEVKAPQFNKVRNVIVPRVETLKAYIEERHNFFSAEVGFMKRAGGFTDQLKAARQELNIRRQQFEFADAQFEYYGERAVLMVDKLCPSEVEAGVCRADTIDKMTKMNDAVQAVAVYHPGKLARDLPALERVIKDFAKKNKWLLGRISSATLARELNILKAHLTEEVCYDNKEMGLQQCKKIVSYTAEQNRIGCNPDHIPVNWMHRFYQGKYIPGKPWVSFGQMFYDVWGELGYYLNFAPLLRAGTFGPCDPAREARTVNIPLTYHADGSVNQVQTRYFPAINRIPHGVPKPDAAWNSNCQPYCPRPGDYVIECEPHVRQCLAIKDIFGTFLMRHFKDELRSLWGVDFFGRYNWANDRIGQLVPKFNGLVNAAAMDGLNLVDLGVPHVLGQKFLLVSADKVGVSGVSEFEFAVDGLGHESHDKSDFTCSTPYNIWQDYRPASQPIEYQPWRCGPRVGHSCQCAHGQPQARMGAKWCDLRGGHCFPYGWAHRAQPGISYQWDCQESIRELKARHPHLIYDRRSKGRDFGPQIEWKWQHYGGWKQAFFNWSPWYQKKFNYRKGPKFNDEANRKEYNDLFYSSWQNKNGNGKNCLYKPCMPWQVQQI